MHEQRYTEISTTGIPGLDETLGGGYPRGRTILVSGPAGSGKTTFGLQYLVSGILNDGEAGIYISFDERLENVRNDVKSFDWDLQALEDQNLLVMIDGFSARAGVSSNEKFQTRTDIDELLTQLISLIDEIRAERVVVDSITAVALSLTDEATIRKEILKLGAVMSSLSCTTLLTSEMTRSGEISRFGVEEFMASGCVVLDFDFKRHQGVRSITVRKMRGISHQVTKRPAEIGNDGFKMFPGEQFYY
ncbi:MAG: ATPase domain-containing protein [Candidatus Kariarchaeaceae archaeon]